MNLSHWLKAAKTQKSILLRALGSFGLVLVIFGCIAWLIAAEGLFLWSAYVQLFLGLAMLLVYLWNFSRSFVEGLKSNQEGALGILGGVFFVFALIGLNVAAHSEWGETRFDLTTNKIHSLSSESETIVQAIDSPIQIMSFATQAQLKPQVKRVVDRYRSINPRIEFEEYDPNLEPALLQRFSAVENQVVVFNPERENHVLLSSDQISEQGFTMALYRVAAGSTPIVYFLQGNGEAELEDQGAGGLFVAKALMEREGYQVKALSLRDQQSIPADAEAVVLWGSTKAFPSAYNEILSRYLNQGGKLVVGLNPIYSTSMDRILSFGIEKLLSDYGVQVRPAVIAQQIRDRSGRNQYVWQSFGVEFADHPITSIFQEAGNAFVQFNFALPLQFRPKDGLNHVALVRTNANTRLMTDVGALLRGQAPTGDESGPFALAQLVQKKITEDSSAELIVFGNASFLTTSEIESGFNRDLFLNSLDHLTGREKTQFIRPRFFQSSTLDMSEDQKAATYYASLFLFPQIIILFGLGVWTYRRSRP